MCNLSVLLRPAFGFALLTWVIPCIAQRVPKTAPVSQLPVTDPGNSYTASTEIKILGPKVSLVLSVTAVSMCRNSYRGAAATNQE